MANCAVCGVEADEPELLNSGSGLICDQCETDAIDTPGINALTLPAIIGLVAGVGPFFVNFSRSNTRTVNGEVVESFYLDYAALGGAGIALLMGLVAAAMGLGKGKSKRLLVAGIVLGLGLFQLLRAFGIL
jgi:hypothetical protein